MRYLSFDISDNLDGVVTLDALASTPAAALAEHAQVLAEAQRVLDWAWAEFPHSHGPADEGMDWDHDLQVQLEDGGRWRTVALTLTASPRFAEAFLAVFGEPDEG